MQAFITEHQNMIDLAEEIVAASRDTKDGAKRRLAQTRLDLSRAITKHVAKECAMLDPVPSNVDQGTLSRYHDELLSWRQALINCNCAWPPERVFNDRVGFRLEFMPLVLQLRERVRWEEEQLYPKLRLAA